MPGISDEATLRRDLAAAYRLAALFGWDDTLYTHFSARLPPVEGAGPEQERFLINPFGRLFDEVRASDLLVVDMRGRIVSGSADYNVAGLSCGPHPSFGTMCVLTLAGGFVDLQPAKIGASASTNTANDNAASGKSNKSAPAKITPRRSHR